MNELGEMLVETLHAVHVAAPGDMLEDLPAPIRIPNACLDGVRDSHDLHRRNQTRAVGAGQQPQGNHGL